MIRQARNALLIATTVAMVACSTSESVEFTAQTSELTGAEMQGFATAEPSDADVRFEQFMQRRGTDSTTPAWQMRIHWSRQDHGLVERRIQIEWKRLDTLYPSLTLYAKSLEGPMARGRETAMQMAIDAARGKLDQRAFDIALSTQLHDQEAARTLADAGAANVADYLRKR